MRRPSLSSSSVRDSLYVTAPPLNRREIMSLSSACSLPDFLYLLSLLLLPFFLCLIIRCFPFRLNFSFILYSFLVVLTIITFNFFLCLLQSSRFCLYSVAFFTLFWLHEMLYITANSQNRREMLFLFSLTCSCSSVPFY